MLCLPAEPACEPRVCPANTLPQRAAVAMPRCLFIWRCIAHAQLTLTPTQRRASAGSRRSCIVRARSVRVAPGS